MTPADAERFDRIARGIQFGATFKDLRFLVSLVEKLDKQAVLIERLSQRVHQVATAEVPKRRKRS